MGRLAQAENVQLEQWREKWAEMGARALERAGHEIEADRWREGHRPLPAQREAALTRGDHEYAEAITRDATTHCGPQVDAMQRKGMEIELGNAYRDAIPATERLMIFAAKPPKLPWRSPRPNVSAPPTAARGPEFQRMAPAHSPRFGKRGTTATTPAASGRRLTKEGFRLLR